MGCRLKGTPMDRRGLAEITRETGISLAIATLFLSLVTGLNILHTHETAWLANGGDLEQQYLGWEFFRREPYLQYPLGKLHGLGLGLAKSIVFTDSIPILAIPAKWLTREYDGAIQITGIWILISTTLMHLFGKRCLYALNTNPVHANILATSIMASPAFLNRFSGNHGHASLLGQWLILAGIFLVLAKNNQKKAWIPLIIASLLVHAYIFAMVFTIGMSTKSSRAACLSRTCLSMLAISAITAGYIDIDNFLQHTSYFHQGTYGTFKWNTISMLNPHPGWSLIVPRLWEVTNGEYEGFSYLGLITFAGVFSGAMLLATGRRVSKLPEITRFSPLLPPSLIMALFAMTLSIGVGPSELSIAGLPWPLSILGNTFRASGRFIWPLYYVATIASLYCLDQLASLSKRRTFSTALIVTAVTLSTADMSHALLRIKAAHSPSERNLTEVVVNKELKERAIDSVILENTKNSPEEWPSLLKLALSKGATINTGYFSRHEEKDVLRHNKITAKMLQEKSFPPKRLILINRTRQNLYDLSSYIECSDSELHLPCITDHANYIALYTGNSSQQNRQNNIPSENR